MAEHQGELVKQLAWRPQSIRITENACSPTGLIIVCPSSMTPACARRMALKAGLGLGWTFGTVDVIEEQTPVVPPGTNLP